MIPPYELLAREAINAVTSDAKANGKRSVRAIDLFHNREKWVRVYRDKYGSHYFDEKLFAKYYYAVLSGVVQKSTGGG